MYWHFLWCSSFSFCCKLCFWEVKQGEVCDPLDISRSFPSFNLFHWMRLTGQMDAHRALAVWMKRLYRCLNSSEGTRASPPKSFIPPKYLQLMHWLLKDNSILIYVSCMPIYFFQNSNLCKHPECILEQMKQTQNTFFVVVVVCFSIYVYIYLKYFILV